ncbi:MAG TPA: methyltransferase domain-containing protein [Casimicrobiaceae bacterium]
MDVRELEILGAEISRHWYYRSKARLLRQSIAGRQFRTVADIGAGSGYFSRTLLSLGVARRAVCIDVAYPEESMESVDGREISFVREWQSDGTADLYLFMDVLEHLENPVDVLRRYVEQMPVGALCIITVPAFQFLWSGHDVFLGHVRRYTLREIENELRIAGLTVLSGRYFYAVLFPVVSMLRLIDRWKLKRRKIAPRSALKPCRGLLNELLIRMHDFERKFLFPVNRVAGLTAICVARKTA